MKKFINARLKGERELVTIVVDGGVIKEISKNPQAGLETAGTEGWSVMQQPTEAHRLETQHIVAQQLMAQQGTLQQPLAQQPLVQQPLVQQSGVDGCEVIDLGGKLVVPPYVDPHLHLDYVFTASMGEQNGSGTLFEGIQRWSESKGNTSISEMKDRIYKGLRKEMLQGVQAIRTHIDVTDPTFTGLKAALEVREEVKDKLDLQIVAFPQEGMYAYKGGDELVEEALKMGADCVGAIPHFELAREFGEKSIHKCVELAVKYDRLIDVHCDETDDIMSRFLELLNALVLMEGIGARTSASHTCSFGSADNSYAFRMMKLLKKSGINFISCPTENIYLEGRQDTYPKRRGLTRVKELNDNGINVCFAQDSMSDPWYPLGNGNMMMILDHGIHIAQMMSPAEIENALDLVTTNGAVAMNLSDRYGIEAGKPANFIVLDAASEFEAVCERTGTLASVRNGEFLYRREPSRLTFVDALLEG